MTYSHNGGILLGNHDDDHDDEDDDDDDDDDNEDDGNDSDNDKGCTECHGCNFAIILFHDNDCDLGNNNVDDHYCDDD